MKLRLPRNPSDPSWREQMPGIPDRLGQSTGYLLIALVEAQYTYYVCFCDESRTQVWIEKQHKLMATGTFSMEQLVQIEDNDEFAMIHNYLIKEGVLDDTKTGNASSN